MTLLRIFGDEAGTMPQDDDGDVFTAATVATLNEVPQIEQTNGHVPWLIEQLRTWNVVPCVGFLKPRPGYGQAIQQKMQKIDTMARVTRLMTGMNRKYLSRDGLPTRNYIWLHIMAQSIARAVTAVIFRTEITAIEITLDQKTMTVPTRTLFEKISSKIPIQLAEALNEASKTDPEKVSLYKSRVSFSSDAISLRWSDQACASGSEGGLCLAHYLASHYRTGLLRSSEPRIKTLLRENGFTRVEIDLTDLFLAPLDRKTVREWEINTGLKEPKL